jgi:hypothetical protein
MEYGDPSGFFFLNMSIIGIVFNSFYAVICMIVLKPFAMTGCHN